MRKTTFILAASAVILFGCRTVTSADINISVDKLTKAIFSNNYVFTVSDNGQADILFYIGESTDVFVPDTIEQYVVTSISPYAFGNSELKKVHIPYTVKNIEEYAVGYSRYNDEDSVKNSDLKIFCHEDSAAYKYALENEFEKQVEKHNYKTTVKKKVDCTHNGLVKYECACGRTYNETVNKLGHSYSVKVKTVKATLKSKGYTVFRCYRCNKTSKKNYKSKLINISKSKSVNFTLNYPYTGITVKPSPVIKYKDKLLKKNIDYTLSYSKQKNVGCAALTVTGKGAFGGKKKINFRVVPANIKNAKTDKIKKIVKFNGEPKEQSFGIYYNGIKLIPKNDYTVSYKNNVNVGTAVMTIRGKGNFSGLSKVKFKIRKIGWTNVNGNKYYYTEEGKAYKKGIYWIGKNEFMFSDSGVMQKGWQKISEGYCLFDRISGKRIFKGKIDGIKIGKDGFAHTDKKGVQKIETMMKAAGIMRKVTKPSDSMAEKRMKCFKWVLSFPYRQYRKLKPIYRMKGWEVIFANDIFDNHQGCCVSESAATAFLFREIGYKDVSVCHDTSHAWTTIGKRLYDPVFAEAKSFSANYNVIPTDYRIHPVGKRTIG